MAHIKIEAVEENGKKGLKLEVDGNGVELVKIIAKAMEVAPHFKHIFEAALLEVEFTNFLKG